MFMQQLMHSVTRHLVQAVHQTTAQRQPNHVDTFNNNTETTVTSSAVDNRTPPGSSRLK